MLDAMKQHNVAIPAGWRTRWLERTLPALHCFTTMEICVLTLASIVVGLAVCWSLRKSKQELSSNPTNRAAILSNMSRRVLGWTQWNFYVALVYLASVTIISAVDAVICITNLRKDAKENPETWTSQLVIEIALYSLYLLTIFVASFVLVPLLQMLLVTWILARSGIRHGSHTLADYIPEARFFATHICQIWSITSFFIVSFWAPTESDPIWRYVILQACFGSATAWLEASFAFNFCADKLDDQELCTAHGGVSGILAMFGKTVKAVHTKAPPRNVLPKYEEVAQVAYSDEKELI